MNLLLLLRRNLHIIAEEVAQISVGIGWRSKALAFELYRGKRKDAVAAVHDAVAVVDKHVRNVGVALAQGEGCSPHRLAEDILRTEVEQFERCEWCNME